MMRIDPCSAFKTELPKIQKPARYLGGESGSIVKEGADFRVALCFPDMYEIGMANNAMRILYSGLNRLEGVACERVFSVGADYEELLGKTANPLYSLETGTPLASFDMLAFTIGYELAATNVLAVLDLAGIPLLAADRGNSFPLVIAGGPAITNPAPYGRILDATWIGEAENAFFNLIVELCTSKRAGAGRGELLARLTGEPAVWIPGKKALRHIFDDFSEAPYHHVFPVPIVKPIQDHGVVEIMRGCPNACRFCHAGYYYRPRRLRSVDRILEDTETQIRIAGHREISLSSLSSGDYPGIPALVSLLNRKWQHEGVSFQLPSLKVESFALKLIDEISGTRKSGLTFAVETPLEQWQLTVNKSVGREKIKSILDEAARRGYRVAKFYFMVGLPLSPAETSEEEAIIAFIHDILKATSGIKLNITLATFVPKPHTPFQWSAQLSPAEASSRIFAIKDAFRTNQRVKISYHAPYLSCLEGLISRGDERVGELIIKAFSLGARFDAWDDLFRKESWERAIAESGIDTGALLAARDTAIDLPWSTVSLRVSKKYLLRELERSIASTPTDICEQHCAAVCGACSDSLSISGDDAIRLRLSELTAELSAGNKQGPGSETALRLGSRLAPPDGTRHRFLFNYTKLTRSAFFAHHEIQSIISSAFYRSGLPVAYSQGFNPMPRLEISEPLSLGFESRDEYGVAILTGAPDSDPASLMTAANEYLHVDLKIHAALLLECREGRRFPSLSSVHWGSRFKIDFSADSFNPEIFKAHVDTVASRTESLAGLAISCAGTTIELLLPFTGKRELGLPGLFEAAYGRSLREAKVSVLREAQYAKDESGSRIGYFDRYINT